MQTFFAGADIREPPDEPDADWGSSRRESYLLRTDITRPLSFDRNVWRVCRIPDGESASALLPWIGVEEVRQRAIGWTRITRARCVVIAIGLLVPSDVDAALARENGIDTAVQVQPDWQFLGFDVADGATSGLSNCGYDKDEVDAFRATWASRLNEHGLFREAADAMLFRAVTDDRVPEHTPFAVYGIWIVEAVS